MNDPGLPLWVARFQPLLDEYSVNKIYAFNDPEFVLYVRTGTLLVSALQANGSMTSASVRAFGSVVGIERIVGITTPYEILALKTSSVALVRAQPLRAVLMNLPEDSVVSSLLQDMLRLTGQAAEEAQLQHGRAIARTARFLYLTGTSVGKLQPYKEIVSFPRHVMARLLGMRAETVSRSLAELASSGAIAVKRTHIRILDFAKLQQISENG